MTVMKNQYLNRDDNNKVDDQKKISIISLMMIMMMIMNLSHVMILMLIIFLFIQHNFFDKESKNQFPKAQWN